MGKFIISAFADEIDPQLTTQMDVLDKHEIKYIEMRGVNGKNLTQYTLGEVRDIKKQLDARGFKISAVGSPIGKIKITDDFEPHLELFRHTLEIAKILETQYIRMFSFFMPKGEAPEQYRDEVMERWKRFIEISEGTELTLLHENEKDIYGDTAGRCLDLLETMNCSYLKAVFDPANFVQCNEVTYPDAFELLKKHIVYMHIKDALYQGHSVVPAGYGDGKVKEILAALKNSGFEGFLSLEPHLANFTDFSGLENRPVKVSEKSDTTKSFGPNKFTLAADALINLLKSI